MCSEHQWALYINMTMQAQLCEDQKKPARNFSAILSNHSCHLLRNKAVFVKGYEAKK